MKGDLLNMEPLNDKELKQLLRKWEAPGAPASLRFPTSRSNKSRWSWLWSGRIHVPVPVGAAVVFGGLAFWIYSNRTAPVANPVGTAVVSPAAPQELPNPPATTAPVKRTSPPVIEDDKAVTAALSGFQPVRQLEPKIVRVQP
jgi:hypothetical protein